MQAACPPDTSPADAAGPAAPSRRALPPAEQTRVMTVVLLAPFAAGYFLSYAIRNANGTIAGELIRAFGLGSGGLGVLTSLYFLSFALMQLPAGVLLDRYGPRRVQGGMLVLAGFGAVMFGCADNLRLLMAGRTLMGLGTATALVTSLKVITLSVPPQHRVAARAGVVMSGAFGAIAATLPAEWLATVAGWRSVFLAVALVQFGLAFVLLSGRDRADGRSTGLREIVDGLRLVASDRRFWRVVPVSSTAVGAVFAIHGLWAARWLGDVQRLSQREIAGSLLCMGIGLAVGAPVLGLLGHAAQLRGIRLRRVFTACVVALIAVETALLLDVAVPPVLLLSTLAGFGALTVLGFSMIDDMFPAELGGRVNAVYNVVQIGTTFVIQSGFGMILDAFPAVAGRPSAFAYGVAMACIIVLQVVSLGAFLRRGRAPEVS